MVLVGDLNIAPLEHDVWSHKQLLNVVSHTPVETEGLLALQAAYGFVDAVRAVVPARARSSTRGGPTAAQDWAASDRGRRLDHVWLSPELAPQLVTAEVDARGARLGAAQRPCAGDGRARGLAVARRRLPPLAVTMGEPAGIGGEITLAAWRRLAGQGPAFLALDDPDAAAARMGGGTRSARSPIRPRRPPCSRTRCRCCRWGERVDASTRASPTRPRAPR